MSNDRQSIISVHNVIGVTCCQACQGSGVAPAPERVVFAASLNAMQLALLLAYATRPCEHCDGKGHVSDREIREQLATLPPTD